MSTKDHKKVKKDIQALEALLGVKASVETSEDIMREAQSVLNYFTVNDGRWKTVTCETCKLPFSYNWNVDSIKHCSVTCMAEALRKIGLEWDPSREPSRRWGRTVPAIVPPSVLNNPEPPPGDILEDLLSKIDPELLGP